MNRFKRILYATAFLVLGATGRAYASCSSSVPYVFVATSPLSYVTTNANNNYLNACATTIDNTQVGSAGFYASQIKPTNPTQATFGGSQPYSFPNNISFGGSGTGGTLYATNGNINHTGDLNTGGNAAITGHITSGSYISGANINSALSATQGIYYAGASNASQLDYNVTNSGVWSFAAPLSVNGFLSVAGTSSLNGAVNAPGGISTSTLGAGTSITDNGPLNVGGIINANASGTSMSTVGSVSIGGGTTTNGFINNGPATITGALGVGAVNSSGTVSASGGVNAGGQATSKSSSASVAGMIGPGYTQTGGAMPTNWHTVFLSGTTGAGTSSCGTSTSYCLVVTLPANIAFSSRSTYSCDVVNQLDAGSGFTTILTNANHPESNNGSTFYLASNNGSTPVASTCHGY